MVTSYFYEQCLPITEEVVDRAYKMMSEDRVWREIPLIEGAKPALVELSKKFDIFAITARPADARDLTEKFVAENSLPVKKIYFLEQNQRKIEIIKKFSRKIRAFIEDRLDFAKDIALSGIETFLLDYPWNRIKEDIPNLKRVFTWRQIRNLLLVENQNNQTR